MSPVKKQHFVPKHYLRNFTRDGDQIFAFDKLAKTRFQTSISNVANEQYFYDFPKKDIPNEKERQIVENILSVTDSDSKRILDATLQMITAKQRITRNQKRNMAFLMTIQYFRTSEYRNYLIESFDKMAKITFAQTHRLTPSEKSALGELEFNPNLVSAYHAKTMFNPELVNSVATVLQNHIFIIGINNTPQPFYTSDVPIVKKAHKKHPIHSTLGLASEGIEIAFPLSPQYILVLKERRFFKELKNLDCKSKIFNKKEVKYYNALQVIQSLRQVYCPTDSFGQVQEIYNKHPEAFTADRTRIQVNIYPQPHGTLIQFKQL